MRTQPRQYARLLETLSLRLESGPSSTPGVLAVLDGIWLDVAHRDVPQTTQCAQVPDSSQSMERLPMVWYKPDVVVFAPRHKEWMFRKHYPTKAIATCGYLGKIPPTGAMGNTH